MATEEHTFAVLSDLKLAVPFLPEMTERLLHFQNANVSNMQTMPVRIHPLIQHAIRIGLGGMPAGIEWTEIPYAVQDRINANFSWRSLDPPNLHWKERGIYIKL